MTTFLRALLALLAAVALAPEAPATRGLTIKLATLVPDGSVWDKALHSMGAAWKERTDGRVELRVYPGGVAGDEPDLLRKMRIGQLDAALLTVSGLGDVDPALRVFEVPLLFEDDEEVRFVLERMGPTFEERLRERGYEFLAWGHGGWIRIFSTKPVRSVAELKGLKQWVWGSENRMNEWYEEIGFHPVPLAATDVLPGLQTGLVEAIPNTPLAANQLQWFRTANHMLDYPISVLIGGVVVHAKAWERVREPDREVLRDAAREELAFLMTEVPEREEAAIREMTERGLVRTEPDLEGERDEWHAIADHLGGRMREVIIPKDVYDRVVALLEEFRADGRRRSE